MRWLWLPLNQRAPESDPTSTRVLTMKVRCKPGDLALVVRDEPQCSENVGKLVRVRGPVQFSAHYGSLPTWLIYPVTSTDWQITDRLGRCLKRCVAVNDQVEHPDAWLLPLAHGIEELAQSQPLALPVNEWNAQGGQLIFS
jgi:hypothetical protein